MSSRNSAGVVFTIASSLFAVNTLASHQHQHLHDRLAKRQYTPESVGCFSSKGGNMVSQGVYTWQSSQHCYGVCQTLNKPVMAMWNKNECACGDSLPPADDKLSTAKCTDICTGWNEPCGGPGAYTIWLTGTDNTVGAVDGDSDPSTTRSSAPVSTAPPSTDVIHPDPTTVVRGGSTVVETITSTADAKSGGSSGSGSTIGIAVGVVAGILGLVIIIVFTIFYLRRRRRMKNAENSHARADSLNAFVASGATLPGMPRIPVPSARKPSISDSRLDPRIMVERRMSGASVFADNEDYSRRILKIANPDA